MSVKSITVDYFNEMLEKQSGVQVLRFWAPWCAPCRMMTPLYKQAADAIGDKAVLGEVNVDEQPELAAAHSVRSIPAVVIYKDGEPVHGFAGVMKAKELQELVEKFI